MTPDKIFDFLKLIHTYYPIGRPLSNFDYEGYKILFRKIETKINHLIEKEALEPWESLIESVKTEIPNKSLLDLVSHQFPNYRLSVLISQQKNAETVTTKYLHLSMSLLADYFTVFFQKELSYLRYSTSEGRFSKKDILFGKEHCDEEELKVFNKLISLTSSYFPRYEFVDHAGLFYIKIAGGLPHGEDSEELKSEYPLYRYLFGLEDFSEKDVVE